MSSKSSVKSFALGQKERVMSTDIFLLKKSLLIMSLSIRYFLCGVEYSVILPTALLYLKSLDAGPFFTGVTIAAYPAAAMVSLPLFGFLYDRSKRIRELLILLNLFQMFGNILYALPFSKWLPAGGRFIAGLGDGFLALSLGELTHLYSSGNRLGILSLMELSKVAGLIIGPCFNFIIEGKKYVINTWVLNDNTLPGILMAILWLLMEFITIFCVFNLAKEVTAFDDGIFEENDTLLTTTKNKITKKQSSSVESLNKRKASDENVDKIDNVMITSYDTLNQIENDDFDRQYNSESEASSSPRISTHSTIAPMENNRSIQKDKSYWEKLSEILCVEFIVIVIVDFVLWFVQTNFEILAPYIAEFDYHWTPQVTGLIYVAAGIEIVIVFAMLYVAGTKFKVSDSSLMIISLVLTQLALGMLIYEATLKQLKKRYELFSSISLCVFASVPLNLVCSKNLLTKLFLPESQGMVQGICSSITRITMITGPLISGYVFKDRVTYGAIVSVFCFFTIIFFFGCLDRLKKRMSYVRKQLKNRT